jgi:hypothetical protein
MVTFPNTLRNDWDVAGDFSYYSVSRGALFLDADSSATNWSKKRPRVEKISSSRYRAYEGMSKLIHAVNTASVAHGRHCVATVIRGRFIFTAKMDGRRSRRKK